MINNIRWMGVAAAALVSVAGPAARGQDFIERVNALYADITPYKRSDTILIPALRGLQAPPAAISTLEAARLLVPEMGAWNDAVAWAGKPEQRAALDALRKATEPQTSGAPLAWGQGYGVSAVTPDLVRAKMYTELGDPPLLAAAQFLVMPRLEILNILANIEATNLQSQGKANEAIELMERVAALGRQWADRQFFRESRFGLKMMVGALERMRDIAYLDFRGPRVLSREQLMVVIRRLDARGDLRIDRILFPRADLIGAEQVVATVMVERGGVNERTFPTTMAALKATERPLRLFSEAATWKTTATGHADWFSTSEEVRRIRDDYLKRWPLEWFHPLNQLVFERTKMDANSFAVVGATVPDMSELFDLRQAVRTEIVGTRQALAMLGFFYLRKQFPPRLSSIAPEWMERLDVDPFNPNLQNNARPPLEYFVPMRDQPRDERTDPKPHEIKVVTEQGFNFAISLRDDTCVIYSWGSDNRRGWAERVQNTVQKAPDVDYLIWPSVLSLYRQHLREIGELK